MFGRGLALSLGSALSFALMAYCVRVMPRAAPTAQVLLLRGLVALVLLIPYLGPTFRALGSRAGLLLWSRSLAGACSMACYFWTLRRTSIGVARALSHLAPVFVALLAWSLRYEKASGRKVAALVVLCAGVLGVAQLELAQTSASTLLTGLAGAAFAALAYLSIAKAVDTHPPEVIVASVSFSMIGLGVVMAPGRPWDLSPQALVLCFLVGIFGYGGQLLMTRSFQYLPVTVTTALGLNVLVIGLGLDAWLLDAPSSAGALVAYAAIVLGGAALALFEHRGQTPAAPVQGAP